MYFEMRGELACKASEGASCGCKGRIMARGVVTMGVGRGESAVVAATVSFGGDVGAGMSCGCEVLASTAVAGCSCSDSAMFDVGLECLKLGIGCFIYVPSMTT
jgi:hypothetical protein